MALPQAQIFIMYGQTEATARLSYVPPDRLDDKPGSAGIPVPGVEIEIRDEQRRTLKPHETGDVWVRGPNVMQGYWHDEPATRAVLVDGWLKTGDIGYLDDEGFLFLVGRRSDIIKTGAHRVHPGEIEEVIAGLTGVSEVAVAGIDDELLGQTIAAWVVPEPGRDDQHRVNQGTVSGHAGKLQDPQTGTDCCHPAPHRLRETAPN